MKQRYFTRSGTRQEQVYKISDEIRRMVVFRRLNLLGERFPFSGLFDLIVCRNVIIYFNYELQNKVFKLFLDNMNQGACLLLGVHESILGPFSTRFNKKYEAYFKK